MAGIFVQDSLLGKVGVRAASLAVLAALLVSAHRLRRMLVVPKSAAPPKVEVAVPVQKSITPIKFDIHAIPRDQNVDLVARVQGRLLSI